jgi:hypothetical protein
VLDGTSCAASRLSNSQPPHLTPMACGVYSGFNVSLTEGSCKPQRAALGSEALIKYGVARASLRHSIARDGLARAGGEATAGNRNGWKTTLQNTLPAGIEAICPSGKNRFIPQMGAEGAWPASRSGAAAITMM